MVDYYKAVQDATPKHLLLFREKFDKLSNGCWHWNAGKNQNGYGRVRIKGVFYTSHIFSYCLFNNDYTPDLKVCHKCDNPSCVNPKHLFLATQKENMQDASKKGRLGHNYYRKLSDDDVRLIRLLASQGMNRQQIAAQFDIHYAHVNEIISYKKHKNVI